MDRPVRVLWLIKGLGAGGAERLLVSAARVGDHERFRYEAAYVLPHKTALVADLEANGVPSHCLVGEGRPRWWPWALRRHLLRERYDVVHLHSPLVAGVTRLVVRTLPRDARPALVSTEHNAWDSYSRPTRFLNASLHRSDRRRWAVSTRVRESMWPRQRDGVDVLVHGIVLDDVSTGADREALRRELGAGPDDVVAVTVANFRHEKGYPDLLHAAAVAFAEEPRLRLVIVGQGPLEDEVRRLHAELELGERCRIEGYRDDVMRLLGAADVFVMASHYEGFPIALMEAMASGLPVVATRVGGIPDAVTDGQEGLLLEPRDPHALAAALVDLTRDPGRRQAMAARARARGQGFDVRTAVAATETAYAELAAARR
ncbi:glycosyltransferase [Nocardioides mesophilus]|uniref:Glycosyltransferase n=1 Tax=Nocardioides mesophilus TaxID=433659 RepID=A0A7G9R9B0_9ACTN|nr:glycosyltransferase [Nocardioides mesophilus]QNN52185.1 glycosyltransferase [Nocardioides mesophilus]